MKGFVILLPLHFMLLQTTFSWPTDFYGVKKVRGVNIGSWLVLEKWITPSVFAGTPHYVKDEYQLVSYLGPSLAERRLRSHWETWFTENDVINLRNAGINHIRIPIGYWALNIKKGEPWVTGSWEFALRACGWARRYGLKVMIDLHGAPGSQNGADHSGQSGAKKWFYSDENIDRTIDVIGQIARVANMTEWRDVITIIELLNEPILWEDYNYRLERLKDFYRRGYDEVRLYNNIAVVAFHDAFIDYQNWYYLRDDPHYYWVMLDTHLYYVFGDQWQNQNCQQLTKGPCQFSQPLSDVNAKLWTVVGEWSLATPRPCNLQAEFAKQQIGIYEKATGWFFWNFKQEVGNQEWSFYDSVRNRWINLQEENVASC